jgi:hypothetical protein
LWAAARGVRFPRRRRPGNLRSPWNRGSTC